MKTSTVLSIPELT